jgi:hypothetical protein
MKWNFPNNNFKFSHIHRCSIDAEKLSVSLALLPVMFKLLRDLLSVSFPFLCENLQPQKQAVAKKWVCLNVKVKIWDLSKCSMSLVEAGPCYGENESEICIKVLNSIHTDHLQFFFSGVLLRNTYCGYHWSV